MSHFTHWTVSQTHSSGSKGSIFIACGYESGPSAGLTCDWWQVAGRQVGPSGSAPPFSTLHSRAPASITTPGRSGMHCRGYFWLSLSHTHTQNMHAHTHRHTHTLTPVSGCFFQCLCEVGILTVAGSSCSTLHLSWGDDCREMKSVTCLTLHHSAHLKLHRAEFFFYEQIHNREIEARGRQHGGTSVLQIHPQFAQIKCAPVFLFSAASNFHSGTFWRQNFLFFTPLHLLHFSLF